MGASPLTVAVIGAGLGGVATGYHLSRSGIDDYVLLEQSAGVGGTWWDSVFPGAEVDVTSELYSYSFKPWIFSRTHVRQVELQQYIEGIVTENGIAPKVQLGVRISSVEWHEEMQCWTLRADDGRTWQARYVVSAVGQLNNPRYPDWPGRSTFQGPCFHTARWESQHDLSGKTVAVVGTGSTSAQVVPALADVVDRLYLFQRQPAWVLPKPDRDYDERELRRLRRYPMLLKVRRLRTFLRIERLRPVAKPGAETNSRMKQLALDYLDDAIADPEVRLALTPDYPFYGKRIVQSKDFYPSLNRPSVTVVPHAVVALTEDGIVDAAGVERRVDAVVMATGFQPMNFLATLSVVGPGDVALHEQWGEEPSAFLGLMVPGFPNFFMLYGPNTNGGDVLFTLERQAEWVARAVRRAKRKSYPTLLVRPTLFRWLDRRITAKNQSTTWAQASNYYKSKTGRIVTQWPYSHSLYWLLLRLFGTGIACTGSTRSRHRSPADRASIARGTNSMSDMSEDVANPCKQEPV